MPCELVRRNEFVSAVLPDGTYFHNYFDLDKLESHLKQLSPQDSAIIDEYILGKEYFDRVIEPEAIDEFRKILQETEVDAVVNFN